MLRGCGGSCWMDRRRMVRSQQGRLEEFVPLLANRAAGHPARLAGLRVGHLGLAVAGMGDLIGDGGREWLACRTLSSSRPGGAGESVAELIDQPGDTHGCGLQWG